MVWSTYKEKVKQLSDQLVDLQRPIRVLDAIKWPSSIDDQLKKSKFKDLPKVDAAFYSNECDLGFDPVKKKADFAELQTKITKDLGEEDTLGRLMAKCCEEYQRVIDMLMARGTKQFYELSAELYGSPKHKFRDGTTGISEISRYLYSIFSVLGDHVLDHHWADSITAETAVHMLNERFAQYFCDNTVRAKLSDGIVADSAAGGDTVKIKEGAIFSERDIHILEVHEGWGHVGTTLNGLNQHVATFLAKGPPRVSATQEGLAVLLEIFSFASYPRRARTINDRVLGIDKAEDGANLLELIEFFRVEGYSEQDCINNAKRVFRGGDIRGGAPFTKDISYVKGFIENYNFMRAAMRAGKPEYIRFIFAGKLSLDDIPSLYEKHKEGIIDEPKYLPPFFKDLNGVAVLMSFSNVFNMINMEKVQQSFAKIF